LKQADRSKELLETVVSTYPLERITDLVYPT